MKFKLIPLQKHGDDRGLLVSLERERNIPFKIERISYLFNAQEALARGFRAHKKLHQVAIVLKGACRFIFNDGTDKVDILLDNPALGLLIEPKMWYRIASFSSDCVLIVLADDVYREADDMMNHAEFIEMSINENP